VFKITKPTVNERETEYAGEASRDKKQWITMSKVSGQAVGCFIHEPGGASNNWHFEVK